jgi:capsular polysaccharide biosynthesis protein
VTSPEILRRLVRRFGLLILLTVIGGSAGAAYAATKTPAYTAKAYVVAIGDPGESITALNFAQAYGRIATSGPVLAKAATALGTQTAGLNQVTASTSPDAPVIEISATGTSPAHTAALANAVANALADYGSARKADTHVGFALLAGALTPKSPTSPKPPLELAVGAAGGLLIGGLTVLAGVGRGAAKVKEKQVKREPEDVREEESDGQLAQLEQFMGVARAKDKPKEITAYPDEASADLENVIPGQRIVGRAVVGNALVAQTVVGRVVVSRAEGDE